MLSVVANKAIGLDNISANLLKSFAQLSTCSITKLIIVHTHREVPKDMDMEVTALFKSGERINPTNYRPISILPTHSKILESVIHSRLYECHFDSNNLLSKKQCSFRSKRSTATALSGFVDEVLLNIGKREHLWFCISGSYKGIRYRRSWHLLVQIVISWSLHPVFGVVFFISE